MIKFNELIKKFKQHKIDSFSRDIGWVEEQKIIIKQDFHYGKINIDIIWNGEYQKNGKMEV